MTCSNIFNRSPSLIDKTQGATHGSYLPFLAPSFLLTTASFPFLQLPSLVPHFPRLHCSNTKHSLSHSYVTLLWLHTFISFPLAFSLCSPNELFLKFLLMNHQFCEAFPWTSLKHDFLSTLYSTDWYTFFTLFPCLASRWDWKSGGWDHDIIFPGAIPWLGT